MPVTICVIWVTSALISFLPISLDLHSAAKDNEDEAGVVGGGNNNGTERGWNGSGEVGRWSCRG